MPDTRITTMVNKITALQQAVNDLSQRQHDLEATQTEERARTDLKFGWIMAKLELLQSVRRPDKQPIHTNETTQPTPPSRQATFNCNNNHSTIVSVQQSTTALSENSSIVSAKPSFLSDNNITTLKLTPSTFKTGSPQTNSISPEKWSLPNGKTKNELQVPEYLNNELPSIVVAWIQVSFSTNLSSTCNNGLSVEISVPTRKANSSNMFCTQGVCQNAYEKLIVYFLRAKPPDDLPFNISREMVKCGVRLEMVQREMDALASEKESALKDLEATSEYLRTEEKERNTLKVEVEVRSREVVELKAKVEEILVSENEVLKQLQRLMKYKNEMDVMIAGKVAVVCGYGDVGKGYTATLKQAGARVIVTEVDTICALHATIESLQILSLTDMVFETNILVTTTENKDIIMLGDIRKIKNNAIVGNIGHFDNETDMMGIPVANFEGVKLLPYHQQIVHYRLLLKLVEHIYGLCKVLECIGNVSNVQMFLCRILTLRTRFSPPKGVMLQTVLG